MIGRRALITIVASLILGVAHLAGQNAEPKDGDRKPVDIASRLMRPVQVGDSSVMAMVGEVMLYHNGTLITCDSLLRYSDQLVECFGNVLINQDSIYVYGDRAIYNGTTNVAEIFAPLIKLIDGTATVYTYNFKFNTKDNIGEYYGGCTMVQGENRMESDRGYYYADSHVMIGVDNVELRNEEYMLRSDSVGYNFDTEIASFFSRSTIWNYKNEILSADEGDYYYNEERYRFRGNAYLLSPEYEVWADSLDYEQLNENAELWNNVQIRNDEEQTIVFGDYVRYLGADGEALLTDNPSMLSFQTENADTVYMRSDSIFIYTLDSLGYYKLNRPDSTELAEIERIRLEEAERNNARAERGGRGTQGAATIANDESTTTEVVGADAEDAAGVVAGEEEVATDMAAETAEVAETDVAVEEIPTNLDSELPDVVEQLPSDVVDGTDEELPTTEQVEILTAGPPDGEAPAEVLEPSDVVAEPAEQTEQTELTAIDATPTEELAETLVEATPSEATPADGTPAVEPSAEELAETPVETADTELLSAEELAVNSPEPTATEEPIADGSASEENSAEETPDEERTDRILIAYPRVKMYSLDAQMVCDSLIAFTVDSTAQLHIEPIMWNEQNQINGQRVDVYTKNQELDYAVFSGEPFPMMISEVDTARYNQVTGKTIETYFVDGDINRVDIAGNAQTYYYVVDDSDGAIQGFLDGECASITFNIEGRTVKTIVWRQDPVYVIYPITQIPPDVAQRFEHFKWQPELRPTLEDVFNRTINDSEREYYEALPQPDFSITRGIDSYRRLLVERGVWVDRNDEITDRNREFISTREPVE